MPMNRIEFLSGTAKSVGTGKKVSQVLFQSRKTTLQNPLPKMEIIRLIRVNTLDCRIGTIPTLVAYSKVAFLFSMYVKFAERSFIKLTCSERKDMLRELYGIRPFLAGSRNFQVRDWPQQRKRTLPLSVDGVHQPLTPTWHNPNVRLPSQVLIWREKWLRSFYKNNKPYFGGAIT